MKFGVLPLVEHAGRRALRRRGVRSRFVETQTARLHVYDAPGEGPLPTTVLLHGVNSSATAFGRVLVGLRPHVRRVVAPEGPGHGFSDPPRVALDPEVYAASVAEALDAELDEPAVVVGNSLGGGAALAYAVKRPERVRALVLVSPAGAQLPPPELRSWLAGFDVQSSRDAFRFLRRLYAAPPWFLPLIAGDVRDLFGRPWIRELFASVHEGHLVQPEQLAALRMPILLLWGTQEKLMPAACLAFFRRHLPSGAVVEEPSGIGHCPHLEDPRRLVESIVAFGRAVAVDEGAPGGAAAKLQPRGI